MPASLWEVALRERRLLVTTGKGFTEYRAANPSGILIVRLRQPNRLKIHESVMLGIERFGAPEWPGLLVVIRNATMSTSRADGPVER